MKVIVKVYDGSKYEATSKKIHETTYDDVKKLRPIRDLVEIRDLERQGLDDPYHEYIEIVHNDGNTSTFRNSCVDIFRW